MKDRLLGDCTSLLRLFRSCGECNCLGEDCDRVGDDGDSGGGDNERFPMVVCTSSTKKPFC